HIEGAKQVPGHVEIVAAVNRTINKALQFKETYGVKYIFTNFEEALESVEFDAVDLCLPNYLHKEFAVKCAKAGKHILVEKPMALTVVECEEMIKAAEDNNVSLMVGQSRSFYNAVLESKKLLDKGEIGDLVSITGLLFAYLQKPQTGWWKEAAKTGGLLIPLWGNHIIDYILWMFNEKPLRVYCESYSVNPEWEGEDEATIVIGFSKKRHATIKMSWNTRLNDMEWDGAGKMLSSSEIMYRRYIQGTKGTLILDDETCLMKNGAITWDEKQKLSNFAMQYIEFAESIVEEREAITSGKKVIDVIRVQEAAMKSAMLHNVVCL
ncbi:MAG: Gfo/Idh/MocA family oxidoreductase, partial [Clostridiaceae bacterium]|nr:Gfo/Idh/MocA family oxidoreductase [Clostridiaceae bacterium]